MKFTEFTLHEDLQRGIADAGYIHCTEVQEQVLKHAFNGHDLYVQSQTGTGKTAAYLSVILQRLASEKELAGRKALIMVPTRELAVQVEEEVIKLTKHLDIKAGSFYGGVGYARQQALLKDKVQIMVGTPGRVLDLNASGQMRLLDIAFLILDEADRMFDMGFYPDLRKLIRLVPPVEKRQTMLFSATLNAYVKNLAWEYTKNPLEIEIAPEHIEVTEIDQLLYHVSSEDKMKLLLGILAREKPESALIFCNTKRYTEIIAKRLRYNGYTCEFIMGDLPQFKRLQIIENIKAGKTPILVATDVAARGLDIEGLELVINYDLPNESENYVHRIGRTGRAGKTGRAISFASEQDVYELADIEKYIEKKINSEVAMEDLFAPDKSEGQRIRSTETLRGDGAPAGRPVGRPVGRPGGRPGGRRSRDGQAGTGRSGPPRSRAGAPRSGQDRTGAPRSGQDSTSVPRQGGRRSGPPRSSSAEPRRSQRESQARRGAPIKKEASPNLAQASFEERMAYYRKKYGNPDVAAESKKQKKGEGRAKAGGQKVSAPKKRAAKITKATPITTPQKKPTLAQRIKEVFKRKDK